MALPDRMWTPWCSTSPATTTTTTCVNLRVSASPANFGLTFNPMAALFGPMWFGARNLWGWVLPFMVLEIIALIPLGRGLWSDLGYEYRERAGKIEVTLEQRREQLGEALAAGSDNAAALEGIVRSLEQAVQDARDAGAAAEKRAGWLIATGIALLLLFKAVQGSIANWALEQRFTRWRSDRGLRTGLDPPAALAAVMFVGVSYAATVTQFTVSQPIEFLDVFPTEKSYQVNLARDIKVWFGELAIRGEHLFDFVTFGLRSVLNALEVLFVGTPWIVIMGIVILLAWRTTGARMAIFALAALAYLGVLGFWEKAMTTVALLGTAACISITLGIPVGIVCARSRRAYMVVRPVLDLMQTMPAFVYLIPVIAFFGSGKPAGIIATMIFGSPPVVPLDGARAARGAGVGARGGDGFWRQPALPVVQGGPSARRAHHHGGGQPDHHAESVDGGDLLSHRGQGAR